MAVPTIGTYIPAYQWTRNTWETWVYEIPTPQYFSNNTLRVGYSSMYDAWLIWINKHDAGQAHSLHEAMNLAILLFKLHPEWHNENS